MAMLGTLISEGRAVAAHRPFPRVVVDRDGWRRTAAALAAGEGTLLGLWGERDAVHMALLEEETGAIAVVSLDCPDGAYPSVGLCHPPALKPERALRDLFGLVPEGLPDPRPWLGHGRWGIAHPLGTHAAPAPDAAAYEFLPAEGEGLHQVAVGPIHAGIIEPGHFRFTASGETLVRVEERLGYVHKGIEGLMAGARLADAARLASRTSGDSAVAFSLAFACAAEAALGLAAPPRAVWLRALMAELERLANHLGDIGAICNDASFALMHAHCAVLREQVLRAADAAFGHRLMFDRVVPGGTAVDLGPDGAAAIRAMLAEIRRRFPRLAGLYDNTASLQQRTVGTGVLSPALARQFGAGGPVGRASGRGFDARRIPGYAPYDELAFETPMRNEGDVNARVWIRILEVEQSLALIDQILGQMPAGEVRVAVPDPGEPCEGVALVEGFRGEVLAWLRLNAGGTLARCHLRDPSWFQWPLLEVAIEGNIIADFPLCNKSFNCSYSGHDL
jgi:Ni,Fe-hydrogenase III large subunit